MPNTTSQTDFAVLSNQIKNLDTRMSYQTESIDKLTEAFTNLKSMQMQISQQQKQVDKIFDLIRTDETKLDTVKDNLTNKVNKTILTFNKSFTDFSKRVLYYVVSEGLILTVVIGLSIWHHW